MRSFGTYTSINFSSSIIMRQIVLFDHKIRFSAIIYILASLIYIFLNAYGMALMNLKLGTLIIHNPGEIKFHVFAVRRNCLSCIGYNMHIYWKINIV